MYAFMNLIDGTNCPDFGPFQSSKQNGDLKTNKAE